MTGVRELKLLLDIPTEETEKDELLLALLEHAAEYAKNYCHVESLDPFLDSLTVRMAAQDYEHIGAMGLDRRTFSGLSETYLPAYSDVIMSALRSKRRPGVIS